MSGNCEYAAGKAAELLDADLIRLEPVKAYPDKGVRKFLWGGKSAVIGDTPELLPYEFNPEKYGRVIFCFPVWASSPTPPIRTFVRDNLEGFRGKQLAALLSFSGGGAGKALIKLKELLGVKELDAELALIDPKDKPDPEKDKKIEDFCAELADL